MDVEFCNLTVSIKNGIRGPKKDILKDVSGLFRRGQLSGILGPSGAGKSTLLNAVSGYIREGVQGEFKINGKIRNEFDFHRRSCYITQEDLLPPFMTIQEAMLMAAQLKLPRNTEIKAKLLIIQEILSTLGLESRSKTMTEFLSGGEKKRLSIALELINNPPVFFLDEPTSGLDTVSASYCLRLLKRLSTEGRTVVCTVHQPSSTLFQVFDSCYFLARGQCVYQGAPTEVVSFLGNLEFTCPVSYNPADYMIELTDSDTISNIVELSAATENGKLNENNKAQDNKLYFQNDKQLTNENLSYKTPSWFQFWILFQRFLRQAFRNKSSLFFLTLHCCVCAFCLGASYYQNANDGAQFHNHLKFLFGCMMFYSYTYILIPVIIFPYEVKLVKKENFNRWYGLTPYFFATNLAKLPLQVLVNILFTGIIYSLSGMPIEFKRIIMLVVISNAVSLACEGVGIAVGSSFNVINGSVVGSSLAAPFIGLACYGNDFSKQVHWLMKYLMKISPIRCGFNASVIAIFGFGRPKLDCEEVYCHYDNPRLILDFLDIDKDSILFIDLLALVVSLLFYRILAYLSIRRRFARK